MVGLYNTETLECFLYDLTGSIKGISGKLQASSTKIDSGVSLGWARVKVQKIGMLHGMMMQAGDKDVEERSQATRINSTHLISLSLNRGVTEAPQMISCFLHFSLFSTAHWDMVNSRPVHSLMSSNLFFCLPCLPPSFTVPC